MLILAIKLIKEKVSTVEIAFIGLDSLSYQNGNSEFDKTYLRIVIFVLRLMAMLIIPAYNAVITSYLAIRKPEIPFTNLEEFIDDGRYLLAMPFQSFTYFYFKVMFS